MPRRTTSPPPASAHVTDALERLGLTALESEVYIFLISESPASGYRIAQGLGKPFSGIYKSLESLQAKGAVMLTEEDGARLARAVPIDELLSHLEAGFRRGCEEVRRSLRNAGNDTRDDRVYRIEGTEQLFARARALLRSARTFVIGSICPGPAERLNHDIAEAVGRGVAVGLKVFAPMAIGGAETILDERGAAAIDEGPGQWLSLSGDGRQFIEALLDHETRHVLSAYWTENPLLCWSQFSGRSSDLLLASVRDSIRRGLSQEQITERIESLSRFESPLSDGKTFLARRYRTGNRIHTPRGGAVDDRAAGSSEEITP
jgi:HTH-type transcriptional regulator, sugar sensing transcriptional regulator